MPIQFLIFIIVAIAILFGWIYGMIALLSVLFPIVKQYFIYWLLSGILIGIAFFVGLIGINAGENFFFSVLYKYGAIGIGAITIAGFIAIGVLFIGLIFHIQFQNVWYFITYCLAALSLIGWSLYATFVPRVQEYTIDIVTPHTWHGKNIVMVADMHYGHIYDKNDAKNLVERINALNPDIVIIPGDFFDGPKMNFVEVAQEFSHIQAVHGVLFANGNHEEYRNTQAILDALEQGHITILNNKKIKIDGMTFAGITYKTTESLDGLRDTLNNLDFQSSEPTILLKHTPALVSELSNYPIDLVVSGHTHQGQMFPFSLIPPMLYGKFAYGINSLGKLTSITTSGVGSWGPPQRLGTRSEIVLIHIR